MSRESGSSREGSLEAPTRHPLDWKSEEFYDEGSLFKELERIRTPAQAVAVEIARFNELASEAMVYGFCPITGQPNEKRLLLGMGRPAVLNSTLNTARDCDLDVVELTPDAVALFNAQAEAIDAYETNRPAFKPRL